MSMRSRSIDEAWKVSHEHVQGETAEPPRLFLCPISLSLMIDPVTLTTGQTFDRCSIKKWMASGHMTCPISRLPLQPNEEDLLVPNHALNRIIQQWCFQNNLPRPSTLPPPPTLKQIKHLLSLSDQQDVFKELITLARDRPRTQQLMLQAGALHALASHLAKPTTIHLESLSFMSLLCRHHQHVTDLHWEPTMEHISCLCHFLASTETLESTKVHAVLILHRLDTTKVVMALKESSLEPLAMACLIDILSSQKKQHQAIRTSTVAASRLLNAIVRCSSVENQLVSACIERGGVVAVVDTLVTALEVLRMTSRDSRTSRETHIWVIEAGMSTLEALVCQSVDGRSSFLDHALSINTIVKMMGRVSEAVTERCILIMLSLLTWKTPFANQDCIVAGSRRKAKRAIVNAGGVIKLVLLANLSSKTNRKALQLLTLLHDDGPCKGNMYNIRLL